MKSFAIIGLGRFGTSLAKTLYSLGHDVMGIDTREKNVHDVTDHITHAIVADATDKSVLTELGIRNFDVVVIGVGDELEVNVMATLLCKELGCKKVICKVSNEMHGRILARIGADKIVMPERDMGIRMAHNLISSGVTDYMELSPESGIVEIPPAPEWIHVMLRNTNIRSKYKLNVIAVRRGNGVTINPEPDFVLHGEDVIICVGTNKAIQKLENVMER